MEVVADDLVVVVAQRVTWVVGQEDADVVDLLEELLTQAQVLGIDGPPVDQPAPVVLGSDPSSISTARQKTAKESTAACCRKDKEAGYELGRLFGPHDRRVAGDA